MTRTRPSADGVKIAYEVSGAGSPALVFVHGWTCNRTHWRAQVRHFEPTHRTVALDLAGHGESALGRKKWTMDAFGDDVVAVMTAEGIRDAILVGHSMGGDVIVEAARKVPEAVLAVVGVDYFKNLRAPRASARRIEFLAAANAGQYEAAVTNFIAGTFRPGADPRLVKEVVAGCASTPPEAGTGSMEEIVAGEPGFEALKAIRVPKFAINSDFSPIDTAALKGAGVELILMSGVGHFLMMEDPVTFNRRLELVIRSVAKGGGAGTGIS